MANPFFKNNGPFKIYDILKILNLDTSQFPKNKNVFDIKDLLTSNKNDITFFHSKKYKEIAKNTKASFCITTDILKEDLPTNCIPLIVKNVLVATSLVTENFYPDSINDNFDNTVEQNNITNFKEKVKFGKNVLIGENVIFGDKCFVGHNTIVEKKCYNW